MVQEAAEWTKCRNVRNDLLNTKQEFLYIIIIFVSMTITQDVHFYRKLVI